MWKRPKPPYRGSGRVRSELSTGGTEGKRRVLKNTGTAFGKISCTCIKSAMGADNVWYNWSVF